jgi:hypothetical protein
MVCHALLYMIDTSLECILEKKIETHKQTIKMAILSTDIRPWARVWRAASAHGFHGSDIR